MHQKIINYNLILRCVFTYSITLIASFISTVLFPSDIRSLKLHLTLQPVSSCSPCSLSCFYTVGSFTFLAICGSFISLGIISKIVSALFGTSHFTCFAELHPVFPISFSIFIPTCPPSEPAEPLRVSWGRI